MKDKPIKASMAQVTIMRVPGSKTFETTNTMDIARLQEWLSEIQPTQLPPNQLGNVGPWCTMIFFEDPGTGNSIVTNLVFAIRDGTTRHRLLTTEQRQKLLDIFDLQDDFKPPP